ncbi:MAG TPA: hypothetical protein VF610_13605 [Segetibacter sp.]
MKQVSPLKQRCSNSDGTIHDKQYFAKLKSTLQAPVKQMLTPEEKKLVDLIGSIAVSNICKGHENRDYLHPHIGR